MPHSLTQENIYTYRDQKTVWNPEICLFFICDGLRIYTQACIQEYYNEVCNFENPLGLPNHSTLKSVVFYLYFTVVRSCTRTVRYVAIVRSCRSTTRLVVQDVTSHNKLPVEAWINKLLQLGRLHKSGDFCKTFDFTDVF